MKLKLSLSQKENLTGWAIGSVWIIGFLLFLIIPLVLSLYYSFFRTNLISRFDFIGFKNYINMFKDKLFFQSLKVTGIFTIVLIPLQLILALAQALILNSIKRFTTLFRAIFYFPFAIYGISFFLMWSIAFHPQFGILNTVLNYINIQGPNWLGSPTWALPSMIIIHLWTVGGLMIMFLVALQGIPTQLYDAAKIDGAGNFRVFIHITIPMILPALFFNTVIALIGSMQIVAPVEIMTRGGPARSTFFFVYYIFQEAFRDLNFGYASALAWVLFVIIFVLAMFLFRWYSRNVFQEQKK